MRLQNNIVVSAAVSAGIYAVTGSVKMAAAAFAAGILLDADHVIDYWQEHSFNLNIRNFFKACHDCDLDTTTIIFHSVELLFLTAAAAYISRSEILTGITLGLCQHLVFDQIANDVHPAGYLLIFRWHKNFKSGKIFKGGRN